MLEIWKIINARKRVDRSWDHLRELSRQVQCGWMRGPCGALHNSIFWVLKACVGSAMTGQMHGREACAGVKQEDGSMLAATGCSEEVFPKSSVSRLPSELEYLSRRDPTPLPF